jgi:Zinc-binding dehydrogenase
VLVTGANGGVGSVAIALLAKLGYRVIAFTGQQEEATYLAALGAAEIVDRATLSGKGAPIATERWAGSIDTVGSHTLANVLAQTRYGGVVANCGLAQRVDLAGSVLPFILRGVTLAGIASVNARRRSGSRHGTRLASKLDLGKLDVVVTTRPGRGARCRAEYPFGQDTGPDGRRRKSLTSGYRPPPMRLMPDLRVDTCHWPGAAEIWHSGACHKDIGIDIGEHPVARPPALPWHSKRNGLWRIRQRPRRRR